MMRGFWLDLDNTRIEELLKHAIVTASEAESFYAKLGEKATIEERAQKLQQVLQLKAKHKATLEGLHVMLTLERPETLPDKGVISYSEVNLEGEDPEPLGRLIGLEEKVCLYYQGLSKRTDDQQLKHLLKMLAGEQHSLVELLWGLTTTGSSRKGVRSPCL